METESTKKIKCPIVGVLVKPWMAQLLLQQIPPAEFIAFAKANRKVKATLYFFSMRFIDPQRKVIKGIYYHEKKGRWQQAIFPFPEALYRKCSVVGHYSKFWKEIQRSKTQMINYVNGFNKWQVLLLLKRNKRLREHLPMTLTCQSSRELKLMLNKYRQVYLKAHFGSRGKRLLQVTQLSTNRFECRSFDEHSIIKKIRGFDQLMKKVKGSFGNQPFIIQEGIDLITHDQRITDVRAQVQRNGQGNIEIVGLAVREGANESPIATHGTSFTFDAFYRDILGFSDAETSQLRSRIHAFIVRVYRTIESKYGPCGEIGIDLGVDKNRNIWFIESNAKPMKVSLQQAYGTKILEQCYIHMLEYATYLSRKPTKYAS